MHAENKPEEIVWKNPFVAWLLVIVVAILLGVIFYPGLKEMLRIWENRPEYSYGYMIPVITIFLIWQKKNTLEKIKFSGSWPGIAIILFGLVLFYLGSLSTITTIIQYAFWIVIVGAVLSVTGWQAFRHMFVPLAFLLFMIPLPSFFLNNLSSQLQLISSLIGVEVVRLFGISVYLEGNVIDLGTMKLQVVEACSGLRYLFPLMSLSFICAYIYRAAFWKRAVIFLSSIPITVLMNSFRIGAIGVLVEYGGKSQAEGFLHDFEGWGVFMACFGLIVAEIWVLTKIGRERASLREAFSLETPDAPPKDAVVQSRSLPRQSFAVVGLLVVAAVSSHFIAERSEIRPERHEFTSFPVSFDGWQGSSSSLERIYLDELKLDDYLLVDFVNNQTYPINLYVAYYASQRATESAHSPRSCIPGGGWEIKSNTPHVVEGVTYRDQPMTVNRLVIQKGDNKQLVYYWFQQRGRVITNEYMVKWYLFLDSLTRHRTDGAMVRVTTIVREGDDITVADRRLDAFVKDVSMRLKDYVPD